MSIVTLSKELTSLAKSQCLANGRNVAQQIEHWAQIGKVMEANPDLSYECAKGIYLTEAGLASSKPRQNL